MRCFARGRIENPSLPLTDSDRVDSLQETGSTQSLRHDCGMVCRDPQVIGKRLPEMLGIAGASQPEGKAPAQTTLRRVMPNTKRFAVPPFVESWNYRSNVDNRG